MSELDRQLAALPTMSPTELRQGFGKLWGQVGPPTKSWIWTSQCTRRLVSDEAGIHRTYVSDIERGVRNPTILVVEKLAGALDVSASQLLDDPLPGQ